MKEFCLLSFNRFQNLLQSYNKFLIYTNLFQVFYKKAIPGRKKVGD